MNTTLPPLRALQAFEAFGRLGSVSGAARALGVTPGAISQQLKQLEAHLGMPLLIKDGRRAALTPAARAYHDLISQGFERLMLAQSLIASQWQNGELTISGLPTLMQRWLNPRLLGFRATAGDVPIRMVATHREPDPQALGQSFRLTYGAAAQRYAHSRVLFTDRCFPVCSPGFLERYPDARDPAVLAGLPLIEIDWGPGYATVPRWEQWFDQAGTPARGLRPVAVHSLSGLAIEAAAAGQGAALAQASFVSADLESGRVLRLSDDDLPMPEPYLICWSPMTLARPAAREFLNWIMRETRPLRSPTVKEG
ncbi:LysR substrate-binding domain-containing protein [Paracoccus alkenifer]|uniref:LysR family transcriptional regulator, glycine cleavage system transcriptional activator n=1 Tax=Paracoccus alkenifer TaxID=65735 RepID=A0A1H6LTK3_9RHOB|nr:LysR substrate-binding domain-containing protein [Paracoccus alkenifer]SEH88810.1 LysR family transcriptional regulator, glycine cleavage system transcriptional activator [Paracoccus alkenifer]